MERRLEAPKVRDILNRKVIAFRPDFTSFNAIKIFNKYRISTAPVVNERNEVVGYLSEGDCIRSLSNCLFYDETRGQTVDHIMTTKVEFAAIKWDIFELETFFVSKQLRTAPVIDTNNRLMGIVSRRDALIALEKCLIARQKYKMEIKTPVELNMNERVKIMMAAL